MSAELTYAAARGPRTERLAEVADVEQSDGRAGGVVLGDRAGVGDRHQPAAELGERGAELAVPVFEWAVLNGAHRRYPSRVVDFDALEAAGIENARERAGLIKYLDSLGFTAEEMVEAEGRGRLFGLAGDVLAWSGPPTYSLRTAADALGVPVDDVAHAWALLGLTVAGPDQLALSQADVDGLATWFALKSSDGRRRRVRLLCACWARRWPGSRRPSRRSSAAGRPTSRWTTRTDELTTAQAYRADRRVHPAHRSADRRRLTAIT